MAHKTKTQGQLAEQEADEAKKILDEQGLGPDLRLSLFEKIRNGDRRAVKIWTEALHEARTRISGGSTETK